MVEDELPPKSIGQIEREIYEWEQANKKAVKIAKKKIEKTLPKQSLRKKEKREYISHKKNEEVMEQIRRKNRYSYKCKKH